MLSGHKVAGGLALFSLILGVVFYIAIWIFGQPLASTFAWLIGGSAIAFAVFGVIWLAISPLPHHGNGPAKVKRKGHSQPWSIGEDGKDSGKLFFHGKSYDPIYPWSRTDLEDVLSRFLKRVKESGLPITVKSIRVERHVATGLWNEGRLTREQLMASESIPDGISVSIMLLCKMYTLKIVENTYYESYEFIVEGHPDGIEVMRDVPDFLALFAHEPRPTGLEPKTATS